MMEDSERRKHPRREAQLNVRLFRLTDEGDASFYFGNSVNVSTGGALIETSHIRSLQTGSQVRMCLVNESYAGPFNPVMLSWDAEVVRAEPAPRQRIAVKFMGYPKVISC